MKSSYEYWKLWVLDESKQVYMKALRELEVAEWRIPFYLQQYPSDEHMLRT